MNIIQGEQLRRYISASYLDYDECTQIVVKIFSKTTATTLEFYKVDEGDPQAEDYVAANLLQKSDNENYEISIFLTETMTKSLLSGVYYIEVKRTLIVNSEPNILIEDPQEFFTIKKSAI